MYFWKIKTFKTYESMIHWIDKNKNKIQYHEIFINNLYGIEFRKLRRVY